MDSNQDDVAACNQKAFDDPWNCTQYLNVEAITEHLREHATGKKEYDMAGINTEAYNFKTPSKEIEAICHGQGSMLFVQMACTYSSEELKQRKMYGLAIGCLTVGTAIFIAVYTDFLDKRFKIRHKLYDIHTVSAADYTIELDVKGLFARF